MMGLLGLLACRIERGASDVAPEAVLSAKPEGEVWIYTSMYQSVIDDMDPKLRARYPGIEPRWFQAGSEKVAQRVEAEWEAGGSEACVLLTSDPFWYMDLVRRDKLQPYLTKNVLHVPREYVDPDGHWTTVRLSLMVMAKHPENLLSVNGFSDLLRPEVSRVASMGDPLASGTMFTTLAFWLDQSGWERVSTLRKQEFLASGGNSSVLTRVETGERPVGVLLLENLLAAKRKDSKVEILYPNDGAIVIPGPVAITAQCANPTAARAVVDFLLSEEGQTAIVAGDMYAALPELPPPVGAKALSEIPLAPWTLPFSKNALENRDAWKQRYAELGSETP